MDLTGLVNSIYDAAAAIDFGRKGFATRGKEQEGRISYETGISVALSAFRDALSTADPRAIIFVEYTFITQELQFCEENDKETLSSLTKAIQSFNDAFLALEAVDEPGYKTTDKTYPHDVKYRISSFPKDSFHIAVISHKTRIQNILRSPGVDPIEKALLKQRLANLSIAQNSYFVMQKKALHVMDII
ncbi:MAG: hypothetical protein FWG99_08940 [Treponema sp.]|nr:hypothetical protein [Treponema sp.]